MYVLTGLYWIRTSFFVLAKVLGVNTYSVLILQEEKYFSQKSEKNISWVLLNVETKFKIEILLEG